MKLLLFSDVHRNMQAISKLVELAQQVDIVIGAGDFGSVRRGLDTTIQALQLIDKPTIVVPGNSESETELVEACQEWSQAHVLHGSGTTVQGIDFWGIGGGIPVTPFGSWSYDFTEAQAKELLADCPANGILVTHSPPKGVVDVSSSGRSLGSTAIREAIMAKQPRLVVCGHIHDSAGQQATLGQTVIINAGPRGVIWEMTS